MVILKIDIVRVFVRLAGRDAVVSSDADGPSPRAAAQTAAPSRSNAKFAQCVQPVVAICRPEYSGYPWRHAAPDAPPLYRLRKKP